MPGKIPFTDIAHLIEPALRAMGFELVQVRLLGGARRTLQVMAEPVDRERAMTVDDCASISETVSAILDVHDPVPGSYALEITSPGLDRPLVKREDFERFAAHRVRIEIDPPKDGRRRFLGQLVGVKDDQVVVALDSGEVHLPFSAISKAKLVVTDELGAAAQPGRRRRAS